MIMDLPQPPAIYYSHPGADPYRGTRNQAIVLLSQATGVSQEALFNLVHSAKCQIREWHQGEHVDAMVYGKGRVEKNVYIDLDNWPLEASRAVLDCSDGYGNHLIFPEVCGNWSYEKDFPTYGEVPPTVGYSWPSWLPNYYSWPYWPSFFSPDLLPSISPPEIGLSPEYLPPAESTIPEPKSLSILVLAIITALVLRRRFYRLNSHPKAFKFHPRGTGT